MSGPTVIAPRRAAQNEPHGSTHHSPHMATRNLPRAIVVGTGAGGAAAARELQGAYRVTVLEAGRSFRPLSLSLGSMEKLRNTGLLFDPRLVSSIFPAMRVQKTTGGMFMVRGKGTGGTTTLATGNALRMDQSLRALGIRLDDEFAELAREIPASTAHQRTWSVETRRLFDICDDLGLEPQPTPKMVDYGRCSRCGRCVLGCPFGAKWDSRRFLEQAVKRGAELTEGCTVRSVVMSRGKAVGVQARIGLRTAFIPADLVVLCAGGLGTPAILERSGIACEPRLFVDPVLCVAAPWPGAGQQKETPMPFVLQRQGFIVSPYFDYLSYLFDRRWRHRGDGILGLMIKLADSERGGVSARRGSIDKALTAHDLEQLRTAERLCRDILVRFGVKPGSIFLGTINAGHPGGMLPLTPADADTLHSSRLPANLYVADATLFPRSLGNPPIMTILALAMRVARLSIRRSE
jgi:choline dehydrogenase-like flavoprotein